MTKRELISILSNTDDNAKIDFWTHKDSKDLICVSEMSVVGIKRLEDENTTVLLLDETDVKS